MNKSIEGINRMTLSLLGLKTGDGVLEIGHGNGKFAHDIVSIAEGITYTGLDWSMEMTAEAQSLNEALINQGRAQFQPRPH